MKTIKYLLLRWKRLVVLFFLISIFLTQRTFAQGEAIEIVKLDSLLWSVVKTIQFYTLPIIAMSMVFLGIKLILSSDDPNARADIRTWMIKILIGGFIIFGASGISTIIKNSLV